MTNFCSPKEPIAWMVYTVDGQSAYVTDNPNDLQEDQSAYALYPGPFEQILLTEEEIERICVAHQSPRQIARAVEQAVWKKNHG